MKNFYTRTLTGLVFVSVCLSMILIGKWTLLAFFIIADVWLKFEFFRIVKSDNAKALSFTSVFTGVLFILMNFVVLNYNVNTKIFALLLIPVSLIFVEDLFRNIDNPLRNVAYSILSLIYISLPLVLAQSLSY